jgi:hypothetical protein
MVARWARMPGNDGVAPEMRRVVAAFVQRMSDDRPLAASNPFAQRRRLAKSGRGADEGELAGKAAASPQQARGQSLDQARTRHQGWARRRDIEFSGQEGSGHRALILPRLPHVLNRKKA